MGVLKRKAEATATIGLRVPVSLKEEIDRLRQIAEPQGFDITASLVDAIARCAKQIRDELPSDGASHNTARATNEQPESHPNAVAVHRLQTSVDVPKPRTHDISVNTSASGNGADPESA
jgi:hypothetical protein